MDQQVVVCMKDEGFEYAPMSVAQIRIGLGLTVDVADVNDLVAEGPNDEVLVDPNEAILSQMPIEDQADWDKTRGECLVRESISHPLSKEDTWYAGAQRRASERAAADSRVIEATVLADECVVGEGYSDLDERLQRLDAAAYEVLVEASSDQITKSEALERLGQLEGQQTELQEVYGQCHSDRLSVEQQVFIEYFNDIAEAEELQAQEWAVTVEETLDTFHEQLTVLGVGPEE